MKIQIDLPIDVLRSLQEQGKNENRTRKNYIESVLIRVANVKPKVTQDEIDNELAKHL